MVLLVSHALCPSFSRAKQWLFRIRWRLDFTIRPRESSRRPVFARLLSAESEERGGGDAIKNTFRATTTKARLVNIHRAVMAAGQSRGWLIFKRNGFSESARSNCLASLIFMSKSFAIVRAVAAFVQRVENYWEEETRVCWLTEDWMCYMMFAPYLRAFETVKVITDRDCLEKMHLSIQVQIYF